MNTGAISSSWCAQPSSSDQSRADRAIWRVVSTASGPLAAIVRGQRQGTVEGAALGRDPVDQAERGRPGGVDRAHR